MPNEPVSNTPPPLTQDPEELTVKPVLLAKKDDKSSFDFTKVMAAIGVILTATLVIIAVLWIYVQSLEKRIEGLESDLEISSSPKKVATISSEQITTDSATKSAR